MIGSHYSRFVLIALGYNMPKLDIDPTKLEKAIEDQVKVLAKRLAKQLAEDCVKEFEVALQAELNNNIDNILKETFRK